MTETPVSGSYISTEEEARAYFAGDPRATAFIALSSLAWYLQRATKTIDALPLKGRKYLIDGTQARQFPREYDDGHYDANESTGVAEVPQTVKDACCEEALEIYLAGASGGRQRLQEDGVQSYSIGGKLQETFVPGAATKRKGLKSKTAYDWLAFYITRSAPIR